jgi:hypothetical protein
MRSAIGVKLSVLEVDELYDQPVSVWKHFNPTIEAFQGVILAYVVSYDKSRKL